MEKKKIYSVIVFLFISIVVVNSVILLGANSRIERKSIQSITNIIENEKCIDISSGETPDDELDEDFFYNGGANEENVVDDTKKNGNHIRKPHFGDKPTQSAMAVQRSKSGVVIEQTSRRVLLGENMDERCYPASTTKVLTALLLLNTLNLDRIVTVPK